MPTIRFLRDFDWRPRRQVTVAYRAGREYLVTTPCAERAVSEQAAEYVGDQTVERRKTKRAPDIPAA